MPIEITRLFAFPYYQLETYNLKRAFSTKYNGKWETISTQEYIDKANQLSRGLLKLGVQPNEKIAIISTTNRTEWNICDIGVLQTGAQTVPIYPTISKEDYEYILNDCKPSLIIVSNQDQFNKIKNHINLNEQKIISFEQIEAESFLIQNILKETNYKKEINDMEPSVKGIKPNKPIPIVKENFFIKSAKLLKNIFFGDTGKKYSQKRKRNKNYNPNYKGKKFNKNYKPRNNRYSRNRSQINKD